MNNIDKQIEKSLNDSNIVKIMNKASKSFMNQLDVDEIYTCQINALFKSHVNFNPKFKTKFTTYLYRGVYIECLKQLKFNNKSKICKGKLHDNIPAKDTRYILDEVLSCCESDYEKDLIMDKFKNLTIEEMSNKRDCSRETVRQRLKKTYQNIKDKSI